jgi:cytochrome c556
MKNIKIFFGAILFSMAFSNCTSAQEKPISKENRRESLRQYKDNHARLELTAEQQQPYKAIVRKYVGKIKNLREKTFDKQLPADSLKVLISNKNAEMKALLTPQQYQTYLNIQNERKEKLLQATENKL